MSATIERAAVELAWRQWTALGVAGVAPEPLHTIDLEPLIAFTACIAAADPRLADESLDWCARIGSPHVARSRLRQIWRMMPARGGRDSELKAMLLDAARPIAPRALSEKSRRPRLERPVLLQLRSRCVFGLGARADVLAALAVRTRREPVRISELELVGYTRPAIAAVLDDLTGAGVITRMSQGNAAAYVLERGDSLRALLAPVPPRGPSWAIRLALIATVLETWRAFGTRATYAVELAKALDRTRLRHLPLGIDEQPPVVGRPATLVAEVDRWAVGLLEA